MTFSAFGDGSVRKEGSFYGFVLVPDSLMNSVLEAYRQTKIDFGGKPDDEIHCRKLFAEDARRKSPWRHLNEADAESMCRAIMRLLPPVEGKFVIAHMPAVNYPETFHLRRKGGGTGHIQKVDDKWLMLHCYVYAVAFLKPETTIPPPDYKLLPQRENVPKWALIARAPDDGIPVSRVFLDREDTKIQWMSKRVQWMSVAKDIRVSRSSGESMLPLQSETPKHTLLELADLYTYAFSRDLYGPRPLNVGGSPIETYPYILPKMPKNLEVGG
jgi:hypothetical protein